jgi:hypothetical protein
MEKDILDRRGRNDQWRAWFPIISHILSGVNCHNPRSLKSLGNIDAPEISVGVVAAKKGCVEHPREFYIVDKQSLTSQQTWIFVTFDTFANVLFCHGYTPGKLTLKKE